MHVGQCHEKVVTSMAEVPVSEGEPLNPPLYCRVERKTDLPAAPGQMSLTLSTWLWRHLWYSRRFRLCYMYKLYVRSVRTPIFDEDTAVRIRDRTTAGPGAGGADHSVQGAGLQRLAASGHRTHSTTRHYGYCAAEHRPD